MDIREIEEKYFYKGNLGAIYRHEKTEFILWAPTADKVELLLGKDVYSMTRGSKGEWYIEIQGDLDGSIYNYLVTIDENKNEVVDPYAKSVTVNGQKSMVVDLNKTNPQGFENDYKPEFNNFTDAILYEMHVRDFSVDAKSEVSEEHRGKFLGILEGKCINHLKDLGITHVHLLPSFDYATVDESKPLDNQYNWGYDPQNYNVPEGSYSTNPFDGKTRIREFKELVLGLHKAGIRVVMDMVYNHTYASKDSLFNLAVPNYYYRTYSDGTFSNASGCGNETASERNMVRKYIIDSILYYATEYHIDGFRFDLMAIHDIDTMISIREELDKIDKSIIMYGEGWNGGESLLPFEKAAFKSNAQKFMKHQIACFSDDIRDALKGNAFDGRSKGFVNGIIGFDETIKASVVGFTENKDVNYNKVIYSDKPWANEPYQAIIYDSAHDNYTLWDKLNLGLGDVENKEELLVDMNKLTAAIILTSQGIPFLHAGEEFARTKVNDKGQYVENSYNSLDYVNKIDWERKDKYLNLYNYYKGLIKLRKKYPNFRLMSTEEVKKKIEFIYDLPSNVIGFSINQEIVVIYNSRREDITVPLPDSNWSLVVNKEFSGTDELEWIKEDKIKIEAISACVLVKKN